MKHWPLLRVLLLCSGLPACVFCPNVEDAGYTACNKDDDCPVTRYCEENLCSPPPWNDVNYGTRQPIVIQNNGDVDLPAGAAIAVPVGEAGVLPLSAVGADARFADYNRKDDAWRVVPVYRDLESDRYTTWIPLSRTLAPGTSDTLAWIEGNADDDNTTIVDDGSIFVVFDDFSSDALGDNWIVTRDGGTGPRVSDGVLNVADNQALVFATPLQQPIAMTVVMRINGVTCDEVFVGLVGNDNAIFNDAPSAGMFVSADLAAEFQVGPLPDSFPEPVGEGTVGRTRYARVTVAVAKTQAQLRVDDGVDPTTISSGELRPGFGETPMYMALQVGGACSIDVDAVWATPTAVPLPALSTGKAIQLNLSFQ